MTQTLQSKEHLIEVSKKHMRKMDHNHKQELEKLKQEIKELKTMNATKDSKTQELENLIESDTLKNKTLKEKIFTLEMSNGKLKNKIDTELKTKTLQNKMLSDRINTLEMETEELKEEIDTQERIFLEMDDNFDILDFANNTLRDEHNALNATIIRQEVVCEDWEHSVDILK